MNLNQYVKKHGGAVRNYTGTVGTSSTRIVLTAPGKIGKVYNSDASKTLQYSLDGGTTWHTVLPGSQRDIEESFSTLYVKGSGATTPYEISTVERR